MAQLPSTASQNQGKQHRSSLAFFYVEVFVGILLCVAFVSGVYYTFGAAFGSQRTTPIAHAAQLERHVQANLDIVINQPGMQKDWPAFTPSTLVVPANSLVTVTLRDYDMGDTPLPKGSPFTTVQGAVGGVAYADGHAYTALAPEKVAHTFTLPQLNINVPLPGDTTTGKPYGVVTFTFRTGAAGSYYFRCFDPCGTGAIGWQGPMLTRGYMLGTLTVQG
jgi:heme/copper-type cytochrome/quinol oxidase subunit 2